MKIREIRDLLTVLQGISLVDETESKNLVTYYEGYTDALFDLDSLLSQCESGEKTLNQVMDELNMYKTELT